MSENHDQLAKEKVRKAAWYANNRDKRKAKDAAYYAANSEKVRAQHAAYRANNREKKKAYNATNATTRRRLLSAIKTTAGCIDCGYNETPRKLEFDHVRGEKSFTIGMSVTRPLLVLLTEMKKCEIRCRSCHMKRHSALAKEKTECTGMG